jgi:hypothetical protein
VIFFFPRSSTAFHGSTTPPTHIVFFSLLGFLFLLTAPLLLPERCTLSFPPRSVMERFPAGDCLTGNLQTPRDSPSRLVSSKFLLTDEDFRGVLVRREKMPAFILLLLPLLNLVFSCSGIYIYIFIFFGFTVYCFCLVAGKGRESCGSYFCCCVVWFSQL